MSTALPIAAQRRGACPTLDDPMPTGDGLLARLRVVDGRLTPHQLSGIAQAAARYGNGLIEITVRGNMQVRGLSAQTKAPFAKTIRSLVGIETGLVVETPPLAGDDPGEIIDPRPLAAAIRMASIPLADRLGPKVTVVIEGGGQVHRGGLKADIGVTATPQGSWQVCVGGVRQAGDRPALDIVMAALRDLAERGPAARAGGSAGTAAACTPIGRFARRHGWASGIALPFGGSDAETMMALADAASDHGLLALVLAPQHGLLALDAPDGFIAEAASLGFLTRADDPRLRISACVGSAGCASGSIDSRTIAARLAAHLPRKGHLHVSGCGKGCAHPSPADWTLVSHEDGYGLVIGGRAGDTPAMILADDSIESAFRQAGVSIIAYDYIKDGDAIYRQSFAIIRDEADLSRFSEAEADLAVRMIHAAGSVEAAAHFEFGPGFVDAAKHALAQGAPILCDAEMVARGVTAARLPKGNDVICTLRDPQTPLLAAELGTTRSAAALRLWLPRLAGSVVAIGNAPTALFFLLEMLRDGAPRPAAIIGMPVGFVGAAESKAALAEHSYGVPYAIVRGRLGGSAMTAAALNALARSGL